MFSTADGRQYRTFDLNQNGKKIEGYAVVFDQPTVLSTNTWSGIEFREIIDRNAFDGCDLQDVVLNVNHEGVPIARTRAGNLQLTIDNYGLKVTASLSTSRGKEIYEEISAGNLDKMSFAFQIAEEQYDKKTHTRTVTKISKLFDVSVVTFPAYEQTCVFARASMNAYVADAQRPYVESKRQELQRMTFPEAPMLRTDGACWAGMEYDIEQHKDLLQRARECAAWMPEGSPEDVTRANEKLEEIAKIAQKIDCLAEAEQRRICDVENGTVQFYGWLPGQVQPNTREQIDALLKRRIPVRLFADASEDLKSYLAERTNTKRSIPMENIEIRALQNYLCKGVSKMDDDERRALTTTGSGAAVIPTEIADRIITNAGHSILTHRANRFADGRHGKLVVPVAMANGGVAWHNELENIDPFAQNIGSVAIEGMELVKIIAASTAMNVMAVEEFGQYLQELLAGEMLDSLEQAYITGKKGANGPADGLNNLDLTDRTVAATSAITIENIAAAVAKLPSKVQNGAIVMGNAATLANLLTSQGTYAFDVRTTLKDMGVELVQNPYVSDGVIYAVGQPSQSLLLNFWQPISVEVSSDALFMRAAIAIRALSVVGFAWVPEFVAKVSVS